MHPSVFAGSAAGQRQSVIVGRARATEGAQAGVICYGESEQPASASSRVTLPIIRTRWPLLAGGAGAQIIYSAVADRQWVQHAGAV